MKLKKGDNVIVVAGKDKGAKGKLERVFPQTNKVLLSGVNVKKVHRRSKGGKGQIVERAYPIDASNVMLSDPKTNQPTRIGFGFDKNGQKVRIAKKSGAELK